MVETVLWMTDLQIKALTALGQLGIASAVGYVAYRQWRTAQQQAVTAQKKLKADLFERRLKAFEALEATVEAIRTEGPVPARFIEFVGHGDTFGYLFGTSAADAARRLATIAVKMKQVEEAIERSKVAGADGHALYVEALSSRTERRVEFEQQLRQLRRVVAEDLTLSH